MVLSCIVSEIKRYIGRQLIFFIPYLHSTFPLRWPSEFYNNVSYGKLEFEDMFIRFDTVHECENVTDIRTDWKRTHHGTGRAMHSAMHSVARQFNRKIDEQSTTVKMQSRVFRLLFECSRICFLVNGSRMSIPGAWAWNALYSRTCFMLPNLLQSINRREI